MKNIMCIFSENFTSCCVFFFLLADVYSSLFHRIDGLESGK